MCFEIRSGDCCQDQIPQNLTFKLLVPWRSIFFCTGGKWTYLWRAVADEGRSLRSLPSLVETNTRPLNVWGNFKKNRNTSQMRLSLTSWAPTVLCFERFARPIFMSQVVNWTIWPKYRISQRATENYGWDTSNPTDQCNDACLLKTPIAIISIYSAIWSLFKFSIKLVPGH